MRKMVIKEEGEFWPKVVWRDMKLIIYYIGDREEDVTIVETRKMDFENILKNLERGRSVFITMKPCKGPMAGDVSRWL